MNVNYGASIFNSMFRSEQFIYDEVQKVKTELGGQVSLFHQLVICVL